jgi:hypothetical protein
MGTMKLLLVLMLSGLSCAAQFSQASLANSKADDVPTIDELNMDDCVSLLRRSFRKTDPDAMRNIRI